ncbi:MAG: RDD family protein [Actinomycetota bacterium]|nr:RDD family protein [Actinomycetota bacterium]
MSSATVGVGDDDFVTGEAVALDLPPASIGSRILSGFLDYTLVWVVTFTLVSAGSALSRQLDDALVAATLLVCFLVAWLGYPITMETLTRGRSLGKMAAGLRTVRDDAGPITFRHALTRGLLGVVEVYLLWGVPAIIASLMSKKGKRLGDMVAGTYVVRDRVTAQLPPPVPMPPHLASWAMSADITQLPDDLAMAVRTFLPAARTMTPASRDEMGRRLLGEMSLYVSPPPPGGNHPEYVLAAVLADRRRRDADRLARDASLRRRLTAPDRLS